MKWPCLFAKHFMQALEEGADVLEERTSVRTDKQGHKVEIPPGYTYKEGPDGFGVAIAPCATAPVDKVGRVHSVPKGYVLKIGKNGKGVVVAHGEATKETKEGQIELLRRLNKSKSA